MTRYGSAINGGGCQGTADLPIQVLHAGVTKPGLAGTSQQRGAFDPGRLALSVWHD